MVGPNYETPKSATSDGWIEGKDPQLKSEAAEQVEWWKVFNDPVLDKLVGIAYSENLPLRVAGLRVLEARAQRGVAVGNFFPQVQEATGSYQRVNYSTRTANVFPTPYFNDWAFGGDASWELDVWGKFRRGIEAADASLYSSVLSYDDVLVTLVADVATAYVNIRAFDERLTLARGNVDLQRQSLNIVEARFRAGGTTELDVAQAQTLLANTEAQIPALEIGRRQAENQLCILLGIPPRKLDDILGGAKPIPSAPPSVAIGIPADLLRRRPDVRKAERDAAAQCAQIGVAKADLYPAFSISGSFGWEAEHFAWTFDRRAFTGTVGPSFQWALFNYGRITNNVRAQDARFEQAITGYQNIVLRAAEEVENAIVAYLRNQEQGKYLAESVTAAKRSVDLALIQYQAGGADYTRVLNTETSLVQQEDSLVVSHGNVALSLVSLHKALGGGWQIRQGKEFVSEETVKRMRARTNWGDVTSPNYSKKSDMLVFPRPDTDKEPKAK
jgi:NodT family efflux transporter outer membrane factor (OMF) lipoprotein